MPGAGSEALDRLREQALAEPAGAANLALLRLVVLIDGARELTGLVEGLMRTMARLRRFIADPPLPRTGRNLI